MMVVFFLHILRPFPIGPVPTTSCTHTHRGGWMVKDGDRRAGPSTPKKFSRSYQTRVHLRGTPTVLPLGHPAADGCCFRYHHGPFFATQFYASFIVQVLNGGAFQILPRAVYTPGGISHQVEDGVQLPSRDPPKKIWRYGTRILQGGSTARFHPDHSAVNHRMGTLSERSLLYPENEQCYNGLSLNLS